ncbi:Crp/Fnr family transcriptional regulator [Sphingomonas aliaeris]|nr:Crp/Fnr family transcriptional regulator [Sphingomonas aliaeris]
MMRNVSALHLLVRKLEKHVALEEKDRRLILDLPHVIQPFRTFDYIIREGETPGACPVLISGFAFRQKLVESGGRQIISIQIPGDALDLQQLFLDYADHNVQALTDASIAMVPRLALRELAMQRPRIAHAFAVNNQVDASITREWLLNVGRRDARTRIAHLLCEVAVRLERQELVGDYGYELPMSQEQIGDATGLTSVHVNRMLRELENDGLITRNSRTIRFPNWPVLKQVADFNPLYLHVGQQSAVSIPA